MPTFPSKFYCGLLIGLLLGFMLYYILHKTKLYNINKKIDKIINLIEPKKRHNNKPSKPFGEQSYLPDVEKLWKNFKSLFDKKSGLDPKFSFHQMAFEIYKVLNKQKAIAASTIRNFYLRRTTPRKKTIEAIQRWIDEENINYLDGENENEEIDNNDNIINNSNSKEDNNNEI